MSWYLPFITEEEFTAHNLVPHDTVMEELIKISKEKAPSCDENTAVAMAIYMLGFSTYNGFNELGG